MHMGSEGRPTPGDGPPPVSVDLPVRFADVAAAGERLRGIAATTPLLESDALNELTGGRLLIKAECLQRTGSFKFRGAYNTILALRPPAVVAFSSGNHAQGVALAARLLGVTATIVMPADAPRTKLEGTRAFGAEVVTYDRATLRPPAVVAFSSGNHAQGVALAARLLGIPASIVMPGDAPRTKLEGTRALGAEVVTYDRAAEDREAIGREVAARTGATVIRPFDEPLVIAGQGTVGLELAEQAEARGAALDAVTVCCGGGGLIAGCALALTRLVPGVAVHSVEPEAFDDTARSLAAGRRLGNPPAARSFCDALLSPMPGEITFAVNSRLLREGLTVSDAEVATAMRLAFRHLRLVVEPGGAVALAAALSGKLPVRGRTVGVVVSGGNVDAELFARVITEG